MTGRLACDRLGHGPVVVLVHGVGVGPWSYAAVAADLAADHEVVVAHRRGYGGSARLDPPRAFDEQVADLLDLVDGPAAFVGVSGGATLVLALAIARPDAVAAAVVHEPVVGDLAPGLLGELRAAATTLAASPGEAAAVGFMRALAGDRTWSALDRAGAADVLAREAVLRAEVPQFLTFAPTPGDLRQLAGVAVVSSVGSLSRNSRHLAATAVAAYTAGPPLVLGGVGHLAQLDGPASLAAALRLAEQVAFDRGADRDQHVLPARRGDQLEPDG